MTKQLAWENFGFPEPGFMPAWRPAEGLMKAVAERELPFAATWDIESIAENAFLEYFAEARWIKGTGLGTETGQTWCQRFDRRLQSVCVKYLNHLKVDLAAPETLTEVPMWTWEELLLEAAGGEEEMIADPTKGDLSPEWNLAWLWQRKLAIDLLLYAPVPHKYVFRSGATHNGIPSSPAESMASSWERAVEGFHRSSFPSTYIHNIYGPDHGWREGSYCSNVTITTKIYADIPDGFEPEGNVFLVIRLAGVDGDDSSFAGAGELNLGMNVLRVDAEGVFVEFSVDDIAASLAGMALWPTRDHETRVGWRATWCQAFADYTTKFNFKGGQ